MKKIENIFSKFQKNNTKEVLKGVLNLKKIDNTKYDIFSRMQIQQYLKNIVNKNEGMALEIQKSVVYNIKQELNNLIPVNIKRNKKIDKFYISKQGVCENLLKAFDPVNKKEGYFDSDFDEDEVLDFIADNENVDDEVLVKEFGEGIEDFLNELHENGKIDVTDEGYYIVTEDNDEDNDNNKDNEENLDEERNKGNEDNNEEDNDNPDDNKENSDDNKDNDLEELLGNDDNKEDDDKNKNEDLNNQDENKDNEENNLDNNEDGDSNGDNQDDNNLDNLDDNDNNDLNNPDDNKNDIDNEDNNDDLNNKNNPFDENNENNEDNDNNLDNPDDNKDNNLNDSQEQDSQYSPEELEAMAKKTATATLLKFYQSSQDEKLKEIVAIELKSRGMSVDANAGDSTKDLPENKEALDELEDWTKKYLADYDKEDLIKFVVDLANQNPAKRKELKEFYREYYSMNNGGNKALKIEENDFKEFLTDHYFNNFTSGDLQSYAFLLISKNPKEYRKFKKMYDAEKEPII